MKKLVSLNVEGDRHLERVAPFLAEENADVVCLQEVFREDIGHIMGSEYQQEFLPAGLRPRRDGSLGQWGIAICTRAPAWRVLREYYFEPTTTLVPLDDTSVATKRKSYRQGVLGATIDDGGVDLSIFTTHFTWTPDGMSDSHQARDMERLLSYMAEREPHVLCGDFNIPRKQNSLYPLLAAHYTDYVPPEYETSMYIPLHRVKDDPVLSAVVGSYMVDYIFGTPNACTITGVALRGNVSDHYAIVGTIERKV
jgi:endonuclease/exonuclease/phosphatase family metal-dependent hydrolase